MIKCSICLLPTESCICPECPNCGRSGNVNCYKEHTLQLNKEQLINRYEYKRDEFANALEETQAIIDQLEEKPETYTEPYKGVY